MLGRDARDGKDLGGRANGGRVGMHTVARTRRACAPMRAFGAGVSCATRRARVRRPARFSPSFPPRLIPRSSMRARSPREQRPRLCDWSAVAAVAVRFRGCSCPGTPVPAGRACPRRACSRGPVGACGIARGAAYCVHVSDPRGPLSLPHMSAQVNVNGTTVTTPGE